MLYIGASPGGLPAGEATPSRQSRIPGRPGSIYTDGKGGDDVIPTETTDCTVLCSLYRVWFTVWNV